MVLYDYINVMSIRVFVAELIWQDSLEIIAYFKANNCYMSLKISCFTVLLKDKNYFIWEYITEIVFSKNVFCWKYELKGIEIYILHGKKTIIVFLEKE